MIKKLFLFLCMLSLLQCTVYAVEFTDTVDQCWNPWKISFTSGDLTCNADNTISVDTSGGAADGVGVDEILEEGSGLTKRAQLNFIGASMTCVDNAGATRTDCTLSPGAEVNDLESVATSAASNEIFVGTGADAGAYIGITACAANEKIEYTDAAPNTFTCETIALTDAEVSNTLTASIIDLEAGTVTNIEADEVILGVAASDASYKAIADCDGNGNALNYDTTGHAFSCKTLADADMPDSATVDSWVLGDSTATTINLVTITQPATGSTLTIEEGFTLTVDGNATVQGTNTGDNDEVNTKNTGDMCTNDGTNVECTVNTEAEFETAMDSLDFVTITSDDVSSENMITAVSDETGSGAMCFATAPSLNGTVTITSDANEVVALVDNDHTGHTLHLMGDGVQAASNYNLYVESDAVQINAPLVFCEMDNAASTVDIVSVLGSGSGSGVNIQGDGAAYAAGNSALKIVNAVEQTEDTALVKFKIDHASSVSDLLELDNDGLGHNIWAMADGVLAVNKNLFYGYSNAAQVNSPLMFLENDNVGITEPTLEMQHDGLEAALEIFADHASAAHIRFTGDAANGTPVDGDLWWNGTALNFYDGINTTNLLAGTQKIMGFTVTNGDTAIDASVEDPIVCQRVDRAATITAWYIDCDESGSIVLDVWKNTWDDTPEVNGDSIAGTEKPTLSTDVSASDTSITSMTTAWAAGDNICIEIESATTVERCSLQFVGTIP